VRLSHVDVLLPHLRALEIERIERLSDQVTVFARHRSMIARCPACGTASTRVHGRYHRRLADTALAGASLTLDQLISLVDPFHKKHLRAQIFGTGGTKTDDAHHVLISPHARSRSTP